MVEDLVLRGTFGLFTNVGPLPTGHADAEARRSVLTALACATLVTGQSSDPGRTGWYRILFCGSSQCKNNYCAEM